MCGVLDMGLAMHFRSWRGRDTVSTGPGSHPMQPSSRDIGSFTIPDLESAPGSLRSPHRRPRSCTARVSSGASRKATTIAHGDGLHD